MGGGRENGPRILSAARLPLAPSPNCAPPTHLKFLRTQPRASVTVATGLLRNGWVSLPSTKSVCMAVPSLSNGLPLSWRHPSWGWVPGRENKAIKIPKRGGEGGLGRGRAEAKGCGWGGQRRKEPSALSNLCPSSSLPRPRADVLGGSGGQKSPLGPRAALETKLGLGGRE